MSFKTRATVCGVGVFVCCFVIALHADMNVSSQALASLFQLPASNSAVLTTAATTSVKATGGTLRRIAITTPAASATIKLFDLASASCTGTPATNPKAVITLPSAIGVPVSLEFQQSFANGICVLTSGATNLTVIFD